MEIFCSEMVEYEMYGGPVMGEMADLARDFAETVEDERLDYKTGGMSDEEAYERGIIDENGAVYDDYREQRAIENRVWHTAEGEKILISDMSDYHLGNAIRYLIGYGREKSEQYSNEYDVDKSDFELCRKYSSPQFDWLIDEAKKRKIKFNVYGKMYDFTKPKRSEYILALAVRYKYLWESSNPGFTSPRITNILDSIEKEIGKKLKQNKRDKILFIAENMVGE